MIITLYPTLTIYPDLLAKYQAQTKPYSNQLVIYQENNTKYEQGHRLMIEISSIKEITVGNSSSVLSINEIPNLSNSPRSTGRIPNINKTPFKPTGNTLSKEHYI